MNEELHQQLLALPQTAPGPELYISLRTLHEFLEGKWVPTHPGDLLSRCISTEQLVRALHQEEAASGLMNLRGRSLG